MPITSTLRHFQASEFKHPELVLDQAAVWLDDIRFEFCDDHTRQAQIEHTGSVRVERRKRG